MEEPTYPPMITPRLIGRTGQLAALNILVEQAKRGEGRLALISGEAGIGKSRLVAEIRSTAASQGFLPLQGHWSSLATLALGGSTYQTDMLVSATSLASACHDAEQGLTVAREIGQRSGEAYALLQVGLCLGSQGESKRAYDAVRLSLSIAEEIEHRQWQTAAHFVLGGMDSGLLAFPQAREHLEHAFALAQEIGSLFWTRIATGYLASVVVLQQDLTHAETLLHAALAASTPAHTMAQRMLWCAAGELALAQG